MQAAAGQASTLHATAGYDETQVYLSFLQQPTREISISDVSHLNIVYSSTFLMT